MTTFNKVIFSAAVALVVGVGCYQALELSRLKQAAKVDQRRLDEALAKNRALRDREADAAKVLARAEGELATFRTAVTGIDPAAESALEAWLSRVHALSDWLNKMPARRIPEMAFLTEDDWLDAAKNANVDTELGARQALSNLRRSALQRFSKPLGEAVRRFAKANGQQLPANASDLLAYFESPIDPSLLQNYELRELRGVKDLDGPTPRFALTSRIVDDIYDTGVAYTAGGTVINSSVMQSRDIISAAVRQYRKANNGQSPTDPVQLQAYLKKPVDGAYLQQTLKAVENLR